MFSEPCELRVLKETFRPDGYALALPKNSRYTAPLQSAIVDLRESGVLEKLMDIWIAGPCPDARQGLCEVPFLVSPHT